LHGKGCGRGPNHNFVIVRYQASTKNLSLLCSYRIELYTMTSCEGNELMLFAFSTCDQFSKFLYGKNKHPKSPTER
jgi:hypothetical protein